MSTGGRREGSGRKKMSDSSKKHLKTFCLDKDLIEWLNDNYGRGSHALVRDLLRERFNKDKCL